MEPSLVTDPKILDVLEELRQREPIFHRPEFGTTRADFESMTEPTFWEVGASGRCYSREFALETLEKRYANPVEANRGAYRAQKKVRKRRSARERSRPVVRGWSEDKWQTSDFHCLEIAASN